MNGFSNYRLRRCVFAAVTFTALGALSVAPCSAQFVPQPPVSVAPAPFAAPNGYGPQGGAYPGYGYGQQGGNGYQQSFQGYPGQQNPGQRGGGQYGRGNNNAPVLPDGIDRLYALQSDNSLVMFGTKEGYDTALEIVRNIDGDLDIVRTQISLVKTSRATMARLGVSLTGATLSPANIGKLVAARRAGDLRVTDAVRITTREDTVVDALLGGQQQNEVPLTIVPRVTKDGQVAVEFTQPLSTTLTSPSSQTTVALLSAAGTADDSLVTLLFVTPTILPSDYRPAR